jgi:SagB-type dehydrogenase family enzyme
MIEGEREMSWKNLIRVLSSPESEDRIEIRSRLTGRRFMVDRDAIAAMLIAGDSGMAERFESLGIMGEAETEPPGLIQWLDRGWDEAIETYLASRSVPFIEDTVAPEERDHARSQAVRALLAEQPIPRPPSAGPAAVPLPRPAADFGGESLGGVLARRRSTPYFSGIPVTADALAAVLWNGLHMLRVNRSIEPSERPLEALQSIGSAFDTYVLSYDMTGLSHGCYFYEPERHMVELRKSGQHQAKFEELLIGQPSPRRASAAILLVIDFSRYQWRYRHERALRSLYFEAGRLMQHLLVAATAQGMLTHVTPAMKDTAVLEFLGLPKKTYQAAYCLTLGGS